MFWSCIDVIVIRVKVSRRIVPFSSMGIDSANTNQPSNREICIESLTNHMYFKLHSPAVVPLHLYTNRGGTENFPPIG